MSSIVLLRLVVARVNLQKVHYHVSVPAPRGEALVIIDPIKTSLPESTSALQLARG